MPLITNATISTYDTYTGESKLIGVAANISAPSAKDKAAWGGIVRHVVLLDPSYGGVPTDVQPQDNLQILSFGPFAVDTTKRYRIFEASPEGNFGLEQYRCVVGEKTES